jgi:hypothetical protein
VSALLGNLWGIFEESQKSLVYQVVLAETENEVSRAKGSPRLSPDIALSPCSHKKSCPRPLFFPPKMAEDRRRALGGSTRWSGRGSESSGGDGREIFSSQTGLAPRTPGASEISSTESGMKLTEHRLARLKEPDRYRDEKNLFLHKRALEAAKTLTFEEAAQCWFETHEGRWKNDKHRATSKSCEMPRMLNNAINYFQSWREFGRLLIRPFVKMYPRGNMFPRK